MERAIKAATHSTVIKPRATVFAALVLAAGILASEATGGQQTANEEPARAHSSAKANLIEPTTAPQSEELLYRLGYERFKAGAFSAALTAFEQVFGINPSNCGAVYYVARCSIELRDYRRAISVLEQSSCKAALQAAYYEFLSEAYRGAGFTAKAVAIARTGASQHSSPGLHLLLAENYFHERRYLESLKHYEDALREQLDERTAGESHYKIGLIHAELGHYTETVKHLGRALELEPQLPRLRYNLALAYYRLHRYEEALQMLNRGSADAPSDAGYYYLLALTQIECQELAQAATSLEKAIVFAPHSYEYRFQLGLLMIRGSALDEALRVFTESLQEFPQQPLLHLGNGIVRFISGDLEKAQSSFQRALELAPRSARAAACLAYFYHKTGDYGKAEVFYRRALELDSSNYYTHYRYATLLYQVDRTSEAEDHLKKSLNFKPSNPEAMLTLGKVLLKAHRAHDALLILKQCLPVSKDAAPLHLLLGNAYRQVGDRGAAAQHFEAYRKLSSSTEPQKVIVLRKELVSFLDNVQLLK